MTQEKHKKTSGIKRGLIRRIAGARKKGTLVYKIVSLLAAILLWVYVAEVNNPVTQHVYVVPVELRSLDQNLVLTERNYQVQVRVEGVKSVLDELSTNGISAFVDLLGVPSGENVHLINVTLPERVTLASLDPMSLSLNIEEMQSKEMPVTVDVDFSGITEGYNAMEAVVTPASISLAGAAEYLNVIDKVFVSPSLGGFTQTYSSRLPVQVMDTSGNIITQQFNISSPVVEVIVPIVPDMPEKTILATATHTGVPAEGYKLTRVTVSPATVSVFGNYSVLDQLTEIKTESADINGLTETTVVTLPLSAIDGISLGSVTQVAVIFEIEPLIEKVYFNIVPIAAHVGTVGIVSVQGTVVVTLYDTAGNLARIGADDILCTVDVAGLEEGEYVLPITATVSDPAGTCRINAIEPAEVTVVIQTESPPDSDDGE